MKHLVSMFWCDPKQMYPASHLGGFRWFVSEKALCTNSWNLGHGRILYSTGNAKLTSWNHCTVIVIEPIEVVEPEVPVTLMT